MADAQAGATMRAMIFEQPGRRLREVEMPVPRPAPGQVLVRVLACGVCRTDLHLLDGEVEIDQPPRVLGHQIAGVVEDYEPVAARAAGAGEDPREARTLEAVTERGARVGVPWLGWTDASCRYCRSGRETL
jgi:propanol-preferring alcohol dehydrogenase